MPETDPRVEKLHNDLSDRALRHALDVLAHATAATTVLLDNNGNILLGPVAGNDFIRRLLTTSKGRQEVLSVHRAAIGMAPLADATGILSKTLLVHFAIPLVREGQRVGTITLGNRPREPISPETVAEIEKTVGLSAGELTEAARELTPWTEQQASACLNMAKLVAELFTDLGEQERDLSDRTDELKAVYNIASMLAGTADLQEILDRTARIVCEVMKVKACSIRLLDEATGNLEIRAVHNLSQAYLNKGTVTVGENPIDAAALQNQIVHIIDAPTDTRTRYPEQARAEGIVSGLVTGLIYRGKGVGVLRVYTGEPHRFTLFEESLLRAVASQAAAAIVNARLVTEALEAERFARQIEYAGQIQRRMIPSQPPEHPHVDIGAVYSPHFEVGGDFYDFITLPKGNLGIAIADVSGKGVPASLLMASLRSALRVHAHHTYDIHVIMRRLNRHVFKDTTASEFATAFYGVLTPDGTRFTYCNAGHLPPLLLRDRKVRQLNIGGTVLGISLDETFETDIVQVQPGDMLLLYTDGATEAVNFHDEQFGLPRLEESLRRYADQPPQRIARNIRWDIRRFRGLADRRDDLTLVVLKVR